MSPAVDWNDHLRAVPDDLFDDRPSPERSDRMRKWVKVPGARDKRGDGHWRPLERTAYTEENFRVFRETGLLPTHEGEAPPVERHDGDRVRHLMDLADDLARKLGALAPGADGINLRELSSADRNAPVVYTTWDGRELPGALASWDENFAYVRYNGSKRGKSCDPRHLRFQTP